MPIEAKTRRIEIRVGDDERRAEVEAAEELGLTLSEFVRQAARARAQEVLAARDALKDETSESVAKRFLAALDDDGPPPAGLVELFARPSPFE